MSSGDFSDYPVTTESMSTQYSTPNPLLSSPQSEWSSISSQHDVGSYEDFAFMNQLLPAQMMAHSLGNSPISPLTPVTMDPAARAQFAAFSMDSDNLAMSMPTTPATVSMPTQASLLGSALQQQTPQLIRSYSETNVTPTPSGNTSPPKIPRRQSTIPAIGAGQASPFVVPGQSLRRKINKGLRKCNTITDNGECLKSLDMLRAITKKVTEAIDELGLTIDIPNHDPVPFWVELNGAWLHALEGLSNLLKEPVANATVGSPQAIALGIVNEAFLLRVRTFITSVGDTLQPYGLLDYDNGFSEEHILSKLDELLQIVPVGTPTFGSFPQDL